MDVLQLSIIHFVQVPLRLVIGQERLQFFNKIHVCFKKENADDNMASDDHYVCREIDSCSDPKDLLNTFLYK